MSKRLNDNLKSKLSDILVCLLVVVTLFTCVQTAQALPKPVEPTKAMDSVVCASYLADNAVNNVPSLEDVTPRHLVDIEGEFETEIALAFEAAAATAAAEPEYIELVPEIPQFYQNEYPDVWYGPHGTVSSHGCGLVCLAMVTSYLNDDPDVSIPEMAETFGHFNTPKGSYWSMFELTAEDLGLEFIKQSYSWEEVEAALLNGQPVVCLQTKGIFTSGGHFIVLERINEHGLVVVKDPWGPNHEKMPEGFEYGFHVENITQAAGAYFIYGAKVTPAMK